MYKIGEEFEITISAPINMVKAFIKSKWRKNGWKLLSIQQNHDTYLLKFEKRARKKQEVKIPKSKSDEWY